MKTMSATVILACALLMTVADASALGSSSHRRGGAGGGGGSNDVTTANFSVPEPSALYAVGAGIALLGGAGWYIRRRK